MIYRTTSAGSVALPLVLLAACATPGEAPVASTDDPLLSFGEIIGPVHVSVADTSVTVTYHHGRIAAGPLDVRLTGPDRTSTLVETAIEGASGAIFTGLDACTSYGFAVLHRGAVLASGNTHTLATGGGACGTSETLFVSRLEKFEAMYHWRNGASYCTSSDWRAPYKNYPVGQPYWVERVRLKMTNGVDVEGGFEHFWDAGTEPFPCSEQYVHVYRNLLEWRLDPARTRRLQTATILAEVPNGRVCMSDFARVRRAVYPVTAAELNVVSDYGKSWGDVLGPNEGYAVERIGSLAPLRVSGTTVTADVTEEAKQGTVLGGFVAENDGFPSLDGPTQVYAQDNASCISAFTGVSLLLHYEPLVPSTPMNCAATAACDEFTVTCDAAPDNFSLLIHTASGDEVVGTFKGTASLGPTWKAKFSTYDTRPGPLRVCANSGTNHNCTGPLPVTETSKNCPGPPPPPTGVHGKPCGGHPCPT
jgi:hypothetical protein